MPIQPISQETLDKTQAELKQEFGSVFQPPKVINTDNLHFGFDTRFYLFNKPYIALPLSFHAGARLQKCLMRVQELKDIVEESEAALDAYTELCNEAAVEMWKYTLPMEPVALILRKLRLGGNPLLKATDAEVAQLLDFFLRLRMLTSFRTQTSDTTP